MRRRAWFIATALVALATLIALAVYRNPTRLAFERAAADLPAAEAEARRLGLPLTGADLMPKAPVWPPENAAPLIRDAGKKIENLTKNHPIWNELSVKGLAGLSPKSRSQMDTILAESGPILDLAIQASTKPACDFERPWDSKYVWDIFFPEHGYFRKLSSALRIRGLWLTEKGDLKGATRDFRAALVLARFAGSDRDIFGSIVQMNLELGGIGAIEQAATLRARDASFLAELDEILADLEIHPVRSKSTLGPEIVNSLQLASVHPDQLARAVLDYRTPGNLEDRVHIYRYSIYLAPPVVPVATRRDAYRARALRFWSRYISGLSGETSSLRAKVAITPSLRQLNSTEDPSLRLLQHETPVSTNTHETFFRRDAKLRTTRALLAALMHRIQHGKYPTSLASLTINTNDPFSFSKLGYRVNGEEVRVYSVGRDEKSNGGRLLSEHRWFLPRGRDIVSLYPFRPEINY